jgi:flagellar protein FlaG
MTTGISNLNSSSSSLVAQQPTGNQQAGPASPVETPSTASTVKATDQAIKADTLQKSATPSLEEVEKAVEDMNKMVESLQRGLNFSVDKDLGDIIIKVVDQQTNETIRQIPSEDMVSLQQRLQEVSSLLFDDIKA